MGWGSHPGASGNVSFNFNPDPFNLRMTIRATEGALKTVIVGFRVEDARFLSRQVSPNPA